MRKTIIIILLLTGCQSHDPWRNTGYPMPNDPNGWAGYYQAVRDGKAYMPYGTNDHPLSAQRWVEEPWRYMKDE